jgi:hypothetical protein
LFSLVLGLVLVPSPYHKQDNRPLHHILYRLRKTWGSSIFLQHSLGAMVTSSVDNRASFGLKTLISNYPQLKAILENA